METKKKKQDRQIRIKLGPKDREIVERLTHRGRESVRVIKRARVLELMNQGMSATKAAGMAGLSIPAASKAARRYQEEGLEKAIREPSRPGHPRALNARQEQEVVAMVCSAAPPGRARWTVELIAEEAKKRRIVKKVARMTIHRLLKNHNVKPWREKNVVHRASDAGIQEEDGERPEPLREASQPKRTRDLPG